MSLADIRTKSKQKPPRIVAYGGAGVGKTYFGSQMPKPIFILTEDGMGTIDAPQFDLCKSFDLIMCNLQNNHTLIFTQDI